MMPLSAERRRLAEAYYPMACRLAMPFARELPDPDEALSDAGWACTLAARHWPGQGDFGAYLTLRVLAALSAAARRRDESG